MKQLSKEFYDKFYFQDGLTFREIAVKSGLTYSKVRYQFYKHFNKTGKEGTAWNSGITCKDDPRILSGTKHPRWKDVSKYYIDFKLKRKEIINGTTKCERCGVVAKILHHKDRDTNNNSDNNLQPLCNSCHTTIHNIEGGHFTYTHNCEWCGKEFTILNHHNCKQRCCSLSCKGKLSYKEGKVLQHNLRGRAEYNHTCKHCNVEFSNNNKSSIFCSNSCKLTHLQQFTNRKVNPV